MGVGVYHSRVTLRGRHIAIAGGALAVVLVVAGGGATYAFAGDIPRGTSVLGIDLGGLSRAEAADRLRAGLAEREARLTAPVTVRVAEQSAQVRPPDVGLGVDVDATVAAAAEGGPRLWGSRTVAPVVTVDAERLDAALRPAAKKVAKAITLPAVTYEGTTPKPVYPAPGRGLDPQRSAEALRSAWLRGDWVAPIEIPLVEVHPASTREEVDRLVDELARPAVAAPVSVKTPRGDVTVPPAAIAKSLVLVGDPSGKITPRVDEKKLRAALGTALAKVEVAPKEATVTLAGGRPKVFASTGGQAVDLKALAADLLPVLARADDRTVTGKLVEVKPKTTTEDLTKLGIKEQVSTFTTKFTGGLSSPRSQNIVRVAQQVDGALVKPGETFSLNGHTGERSYAKGYKDAPTIVDGKLVPGVGGGVSQFTTTLFNASYYAGLKDVEHKPHSFYFSRYPPVIEATIYWPNLDFKFKNDTKYGVLIDTSYTSSTITVSMWSTKVYDSVKTVWSARRDVTQPRTVYLEPGPKCIAAQGSQGFTQDAWRVFRQGGKEIKREKFTWRYDAEPRFICGKKPGEG